MHRVFGRQKKVSTRSRLTPSGWAFLIVGLLVQLAAWNTGTNLLYVIAVGILSFLAIGFLFVRWTLSGVQVTREAPSSIHRDASFGVTLFVKNRARFFPAISIRIEHASDRDASIAYVEKIPPNRGAVLRLTHVFEKRGVHTLPDILVTSGFPLGLFERRKVFRDEKTVVVYPKLLSVRTNLLEEMQGIGVTPRMRHGDGDEFFSLREYVPGDDLRRIAWRVSARLGRLVVRELEPSTSRNVYIGFDTCKRPDVEGYEDLFEEAADLVASLAMSYLNQQYEVAVLTCDREAPLGEGNGHAIQIFEMLARVAPVNPEGVSDDWFLREEEMGGAGYVLVSPDPENWGARGGPLRTRVLDPREVLRA